MMILDEAMITKNHYELQVRTGMIFPFETASSYENGWIHIEGRGINADIRRSEIVSVSYDESFRKVA